jgi:hypothetical protein
MRFKVDEVEYEFDEEKLTFAEGRALEKVTGKPFGQLGPAAEEGSLVVIQGFVWVALKRSQPTLKFSDLDDRRISEFEFQEEHDEEDEDCTCSDCEEEREAKAAGRPTVPTEGEETASHSSDDGLSTSDTSPTS